MTHQQKMKLADIRARLELATVELATVYEERRGALDLIPDVAGNAKTRAALQSRLDQLERAGEWTDNAHAILRVLI
jgi:hypothetical protein